MSRIIELIPVSTQREFMRYLVRNTPRRAGSSNAVRLAARNRLAGGINSNPGAVEAEEKEMGGGRDYLTGGQRITACSQSRTSAGSTRLLSVGLRSLTAVRTVILEVRAIPPKIESRNPS